MLLKNKNAALLLAVFMMFTACTKKPEQPLSPSIKAGIETGDTGKFFIIEFSCALKNENDSTVFTDLSGTINIKNNSNEILLTIPFKTGVILPFDSGLVTGKNELKLADAVPLMQFFEIVPEKIESGEDPGARPVESENIEIKDLRFHKKDIIDLLKGK